MKNRFKGKKAGILGSSISNFWAYIMFVFVVIIFFIFFNIQQGKVVQNRISGLDSEANADIILLNYLRTPIIDEGQEKIYADFLVESLVNPRDGNTFSDEVDETTKKYFPITATAERLMIKLENRNCLYNSIEKSTICPPTERAEGSVRLPIPDTELGFLEVKLQFLRPDLVLTELIK